MTTVMIIDPDSQWFLEKGIALVDASDWKTVDIGIGEPIHIQAEHTMEYGSAVKLLRSLVRDYYSE